MRIGLYFGSFNPIHYGHITLAQYVLRECNMDEVWLMVSPNNPLKDKSELWDETLRYRFTQEALKNIEGLRASDFEFSLPQPSYTVITLKALSAAYPQHSFTLIIGSDNMAVFHLWKDYQLILSNYPIVVYPRRGNDMKALKQRYPQMQVLHDAPLYDISSTQIRRLLAEGKDVSSLTPIDINSIQKHLNSPI